MDIITKSFNCLYLCLKLFLWFSNQLIIIIIIIITPVVILHFFNY